MVGKMSSAQSNEKFSPHKKNTDHKLNKINQSELDDARINIFCVVSLLGFAWVKSACWALKH